MPKVMVFGSDGLPLRRLTQWDADRELTIKGLGVPGSPGSVEMHFWDSDTHRALVVPVTNVDGGFKAPIPNILLQRDSPVVFTVYEHTPKGENKATFYHDIPVQRAQKPEDYVWTENVDYISFQELLTEAREVLAQLEAGKDQIITISNQALESARNAAAAAEEAKRLVEDLTNEAAGLPSKQNWGTVKMDTAPGINSPSRLQTYFFALRKSPNRAYQFEIAKDKNQNIVTACGGVPDGLDPDAPAFIIVTLPYSEAGGFVEHIEYRMRKSGDVRCKDYSTTHDTESASWYDSGWYDPIARTVEDNVFVVHFSGSASAVTADRTTEQINAAYSSGKAVIGIGNGMSTQGEKKTFLLVWAALSTCVFAGPVDDGKFIQISMNSDGSIDFRKLPASRSLHFTGAATGSYDGSASKSVNIPVPPTKLSELGGDAGHRTVTDAEKEKWDQGGSASIMQVTFSGLDSSLTADHTFDEVYAFIKGGGEAIGIRGKGLYQAVRSAEDEQVTFQDLNSDYSINQITMWAPSKGGKIVPISLKLPGDVQAQHWATEAVKEAIPGITDEPTFRTHFYGLRKSQIRKWQFEISNGGIHENVIAGAGGRPSGARAEDQAFLYVELPYSEAGGLEIRCTYALRTGGRMWEKRIYGTLDSRWTDSGWYEPSIGGTVTIEIENRGDNNFWTRPVTPAQKIIDMVNAGKEVRLSFYDTITNTGDQLYPYENTRQSVCYFRRNLITEEKISRISWGVQFDGSIVAAEIVPPVVSYAPQELTEEQKAQARENISALPAGLGMTGATVGQIARIKAVDASGKPTEWEPVDMPGSGKYELLETLKVTESNIASTYKWTIPRCSSVILTTICRGHKADREVYADVYVGNGMEAGTITNRFYVDWANNFATRNIFSVDHGVIQATGSSGPVPGLCQPSAMAEPNTVRRVDFLNSVQCTNYGGNWIIDTTFEVWGVRL